MERWTNGGPVVFIIMFLGIQLLELYGGPVVFIIMFLGIQLLELYGGHVVFIIMFLGIQLLGPNGGQAERPLQYNGRQFWRGLYVYTSYEAEIIAIYATVSLDWRCS